MKRKESLGRMIQKDMLERDIPIGVLAYRINRVRSCVYSIFKRTSIDSELLKDICKAVGRNYLLEMGLEIDEEIRRINEERARAARDRINKQLKERG